MFRKTVFTIVPLFQQENKVNNATVCKVFKIAWAYILNKKINKFGSRKIQEFNFE